MKVGSRNNIMRKLGCQSTHPEVYRTDPMLLSSRVRKSCMGKITSCQEDGPGSECYLPSNNFRLRATNTNWEPLYTLAGIAPPDIRWTVASMNECQRQTNDKRHPLYDHVPPTSRLKSRESFIHSVTSLETSANSKIVKIWKQRLRQHPLTMAVPLTEELPPGADCGTVPRLQNTFCAALYWSRSANLTTWKAPMPRNVFNFGWKTSDPACRGHEKKKTELQRI